MKKQVLFLCMMLSSLMALAQEKVVVNDRYAQQRSTGSFKEISVSKGIDLYLSPDEHEVVVVSASDPKYRDRIVTRVNGDRLEIYFDNKGYVNWPDQMRLKAYVSFKTLRKLKASNSSDVYLNGVIRASSFELELSGSSDFNGAVMVDELRISQSGSSDSRISGKADRVTIDVSGASDVKAYDLSVNYCNVEASGASDIQITVNKEISARASGSSDVYYRGEGLIRDVKTSGSSSVSRKS